MTPARIFPAIAILVLGVPAHAGLIELMYPPEPDVIVNTDVVDGGAPAPGPATPVYYLSLSKGYRNFGFANGGEKIPAPAGVLNLVTKILDGQGYKVASAEHPPSLIVLYSWGTFYLNPNPGAPTGASEMLAFLGADKLGIPTDARTNQFRSLSQDLRPLRPDASTVTGFLPHGMYVITFWAFDYNLAMKGEARLYWKTNISSSTRGFYLPEVLPTMLAVAAPMIGRETTHPIRIDVGKHYKPTIEIGPLRVIDDDVKSKERKGS